jgi:hypothetical protein
MTRLIVLVAFGGLLAGAAGGAGAETRANLALAPMVSAGPDRVVVQGGRAYLDGVARDDGKPGGALQAIWTKESGIASVTFENADRLAATARFSSPGEYTLKLTVDDGGRTASDTVNILVEPMPLKRPLQPVPVTPYKISGRFWAPRFKALIVNWIPHCIRKLEDPATKEGGIQNFVEAGRKLRGEAGAKHTGPVFANGWVYNTLESICLALQVDPQGHAEVAAAQAEMRKTLDDWIPKILSAQEPDGYLHTMYTIQGRKRWSNKHDHEDYQAGYFIDAALAHHELTGRKDARMYEAAKRLAGCWVANIGPAPKRTWYPGHQAMEMSLVSLARRVEEVEGAGKGRAYVELSKFLLDGRRDGEAYDQSHLPVTRQYEAVGHAVRAVYSYAGMTDIALETGDPDYRSAVMSLWNNLTTRKRYVTGGVGSGETSEGFGPDYSLPHGAYCESCASCGEIFFEHRLHRLYGQPRFVDLFEDTLYNALLGAVDLEGRNFTYTNPLDTSGARYPWHGCPCCVGNIARTLLSLPAWMYTTDDKGVFVNLYAGSAVTLDRVAGTRVELIQTTDYPWQGRVTLTVNPAVPTEFSIRMRPPVRNASPLYRTDAEGDGFVACAMNGGQVKPRKDGGYYVLRRTWSAGDRIDIDLPLLPQRVTADERIAAARGQVALRRGPLVYSFESVDQKLDSALAADSAIMAEWKPDLLGGVVVLKGTFSDGTPFTAIPNHARLNRGGRSTVWIRAASP